MKIINRPEVQFQKSALSLSKYIKEMNLCMSELKDLYVDDDRGLYLKKLMIEFDTTQKKYKKCTLEYKKEEELEILELGRKISQKVQQDIAARFKVDNPMIKNFSVLEMTSIKEDMTKDNYKSYGNNALVESAKHYNNFMTSHDEVLEEKELIDLSDVIS